ncbi:MULTISPECIES: YtxH domain-containing protein [Salimicrobium]|uniref:General stress protein n=4 Tax=Salimicrobium TaxID=351195 RepID=K2GA43_9BACI|nr:MULTISPECIES: YtxH domain-containing protein [Salimicrobium]AKG04079.1 general stress protein [Salimicrobium jeotgali]EKE31197.1 hypothetical protein MJ3_09513 [Salimicrobium jeotgali]MBM7697241.1 gas vesicle protein [Salimicrobium jeotgali]PBB05023.1 YtxH domain-containing protein [Salimicrobium humidisoli]SDX57845.1 Gas vesicle protein [Salimicrobium album]
MAKEKQNQNQGNSKDFILGTIIGVLIGAATALFVAPKSGKELREDLNENSGVWKEKAASTTQDLSSKVKEKVQGNSDEKEAEQAAQEVAEAIEEAARELEQEQEKGQSN